MLLLRRKTSQTHQIDLIEMLIQCPNDTTGRTTKELLRLITISRRNGEQKTRDRQKEIVWLACLPGCLLSDLVIRSLMTEQLFQRCLPCWKLISQLPPIIIARFSFSFNSNFDFVCAFDFVSFRFVTFSFCFSIDFL